MLQGRKRDAAAVAAVLALYAGLHFAGVGCPIRALTGLSCAGCGMTRAWLALLHGDCAQAFACHPLFLLPAPAVTVFCFRKRLPACVTRAALWGMVGLALAVYLIRLVNPLDAIVTFEPQNGLLARMAGWAFAMCR